jgi:UDP-glucose 4-epimerase
MSILLTGGNGFIGSHTAIELINSCYNIIIVDDFSNSSLPAYEGISKITTRKNIQLYKIDICDKINLQKVFESNTIDTVIHFAAYKAVGESISNPLKYYRNNIIGLINLLEVMNKFKVNKIVFSSSATVYGNPKSLPITEDFELTALNPYGQTKLMSENILKDVSRANGPKVIILRYFNPVGAHPSGLIGENPIGIPNNLFPYILDVIKGKREYLSIFGKDYDTIDGTCIRDYIHVVDLAKGHVAAVKYINNIDKVKIYNLGTGTGYSVCQIVDSFNKFLETEEKGRSVNYRYTDRREGDAAAVYADCSLAKKELGWIATLDLNDMIRDSLNFVDSNSNN